MGPSIDAVMRRRYWLGSVLRLVVLVMVVSGVLAFISDLFAVLPYLGDLSMMSMILSTLALRWALMGLMLMWFEKRLVGWVFPLPRRGCPGCGYPVDGRAVCPECGLRLGDDPGGREITAPGVRVGEQPEGHSVGAPPGYSVR